MRNLKRVLSLALSFVMVMSMMIVGAGAVNLSDFSDHEKIANDEAVTVLTTLGVINGKDDGTYDPEGIVTRAEMAKMICVILNGGKDPQLGQTLQNTYTDTVGHWAAPYIEYCTTLGIVSGRGNGTFDPNGTVTVAEAGKMILVALGYNASVEGYTGGNWQINTDVRANALGLYDELGTLNTNVDLTRDNAAQMLYNALDVRMVEYSYVITGSADNSISTKPQLNDKNKGTLLFEKFGAVKVVGVVVGNEFANFDSNRQDTDRAPKGVNIGTAQDAGKTVIRITNYNGDLTFSGNEEQNVYAEKDTTFTVTTGENELGKAVWMYVKPASTSQKATVIGNAIISDDNQIVTDFSGDNAKEVADDNNLDLTSDTLYIYNYGTQTSSAPTKNGWAGIQKTLIDTDGDNKVDYVLYREMRLGKVTLKTDSGDGQIVIAVTGTGDTKGNYINKDKDDILGFDNVAKDDFVLTAYFGGKLHVQKAETVTGKIEAYKQTEEKNSAGTVTGYRNTGFTIDAENYTVSRVDSYTGTDLTAAVTQVDKTILSSDATFYLDENGYVIAYGDVDETAYKYAFVWGADAGTRINTDKVKVTLEDGTTRTYDLSTNSDIDVVDSGSSTRANGSNKARIHQDDMKGLVFAYTLTSGGEIKLYLPKNGTVRVDESTTDPKGEGAPTFNKGLTNIKIKSPAANIGFMQPAGLSSVNSNTTYYSNNATAFFYVTTSNGQPSGEVTKVNVYTGRNNAPSVDGSNVDGNKHASTVLALNSKGDVGAAVFTNVKASESAGEHMFVTASNYVSEDYWLIDAFLNGSTDLSKDIKAALADDAEVSHNPVIKDGLYLYTLNSDGYYELTRPTNEAYYFEGTVARVYKSSNTFVITDDGTENGAFRQEFRLAKDSIVVDNTLDTVVAVAGGSVSVGDKVQVIVNNADDSEVLMLGITGRVDISNGSGGVGMSWDGSTQPSGSTRIYPDGTYKTEERIGEAFQTGDVYINGDYTPSNSFTIPSGRALYVTGNVYDNASNRIVLGGSLYVGGNLNGSLNGAVVPSGSLVEVHGNWNLNANTNVNGTARIGKVVDGTTLNYSLNVGTSTNDSAVLRSGAINLGTGILTVYGHAEANGYTVTASNTAVVGDVTAGAVHVYSANTLTATGTLTAGTVTVGQGTTAGKLNVPTIKADTITLNVGTLSTTTIDEKTAGNKVDINVNDGTLSAAKIENGDAITVAGGSVTTTTIKANTVSVTDAALTANALEGNLTVATTTADKTVSVTVPTLKGELNTSGVTGSGNVSAGTSSDSAVEPKGTIKADVTLANANFSDVTTIDAGVTVTLTGNVTGLDKLTGTAIKNADGSIKATSKVAFGTVTVTGTTAKFVYSDANNTVATYFSGLGFTWDGTKFVNDFATIYKLTTTTTAIVDSKSIYA